MPLDGPATPSPLFGSRFNEADPRFSPDGRAMSFISDESGRFEVYVAPFPPTGGKTPVSAGIAGGERLAGGARWSHDGRELFYVSADRRLMAVPVRTTPMLEVGSPAPLFALQGRAGRTSPCPRTGSGFSPLCRRPLRVSSRSPSF